MTEHDIQKTIESSSKVNNNNNDPIILSYDDDRLKILGELFGNITSRKILILLIDNEMTTEQISNRLGLKINLVLYHLEKMLNLEILSITKTTKNSRGHQVKHYRAKQAVLVFSKDAKPRAEKSKTLSNAIRKVTKLSSIGFTGALTWLVTNIGIQANNAVNFIDAAAKYPRPTLPPYMTPIHPQSGVDVIVPIVMGLVASAIVLVVVYRKKMPWFKSNFNN